MTNEEITQHFINRSTSNGANMKEIATEVENKKTKFQIGDHVYFYKRKDYVPGIVVGIRPGKVCIYANFLTGNYCVWKDATTVSHQESNKD